MWHIWLQSLIVFREKKWVAVLTETSRGRVSPKLHSYPLSKFRKSGMKPKSRPLSLKGRGCYCNFWLLAYFVENNTQLWIISKNFDIILNNNTLVRLWLPLWRSIYFCNILCNHNTLYCYIYFILLHCKQSKVIIYHITACISF